MSDFQAEASAQGRAFEETVCTLLRVEGWHIVERHVYHEGAEIDIVAIDPEGVTWWIECKGSWRGLVPGARRGDTVKKALGVAWWLLDQLDDRPPYMLVTSHVPDDTTLPGRMLKRAVAAGLFTEIRTVGFGSWQS